MSGAVVPFLRCFGGVFSSAVEEPTTASAASDLLCRVRAISSRQALASLSTRVGRFLSLSKVIEQSEETVGAGGAGGASIVTGAVALAVCPLSSVTVQVTVAVPGAAP